ncbi:MAG: hypothetical protein FWC97_02505, partial [Treponema sp.]|nr:hypothetical protein [Treponema sp.]
MGVEQNTTMIGGIKQRIDFLDVPIDIIAPENFIEFVYELLKTDKEHNIVLLSLWDLLRARRSGEYRSYVKSA